MMAEPVGWLPAAAEERYGLQNREWHGDVAASTLLIVYCDVQRHTLRFKHLQNAGNSRPNYGDQKLADADAVHSGCMSLPFPSFHVFSRPVFL